MFAYLEVIIQTRTLLHSYLDLLTNLSANAWLNFTHVPLVVAILLSKTSRVLPSLILKRFREKLVIGSVNNVDH